MYGFTSPIEPTVDNGIRMSIGILFARTSKMQHALRVHAAVSSAPL
jgi:hypothetical protein